MTSREGLYIMVFIILLNTCSTETIINNIKTDVDNLNYKIEQIMKEVKK